MASLRHPNIVQFMAVSTSPPAVITGTHGATLFPIDCHLGNLSHRNLNTIATPPLLLQSSARGAACWTCCATPSWRSRGPRR